MRRFVWQTWVAVWLLAVLVLGVVPAAASDSYECDEFRRHSGNVPDRYDVAFFFEDGFNNNEWLGPIEVPEGGLVYPPPEGRRSWDKVRKCNIIEPTTTTTSPTTTTTLPATTTTSTSVPPTSTTTTTHGPTTTTSTTVGTTTTTTTEEPSTTTTTESPTTTTTSGPTTSTTTVPTTSTSVPPTTTTTTVPRPPTLPETGIPAAVVAFGAVGLLATGAAILRRKPE